MTGSNRQALITKTHKVLRKHYEPVAPPADRPLLEHLLYACCLENGRFEQVDEVFAKLEQNYYGWNEVRVTTVAELAEVMAMLPDAADAARRLKRVLQSVFESHYSFDLEFLKKQNLGKAVEHLEKFNGVTSFAAAYVTQNSLAGHAIPLNAGVFEILQLIGVITESEAAKQRVPGMERAIPKNKGVEFSSLLHQFGVDYSATPHSPRIRGILLEITPDAKDRLPKRTTKKEGEAGAAGTPVNPAPKPRPERSGETPQVPSPPAKRPPKPAGNAEAPSEEAMSAETLARPSPNPPANACHGKSPANVSGRTSANLYVAAEHRHPDSLLVSVLPPRPVSRGRAAGTPRLGRATGRAGGPLSS